MTKPTKAQLREAAEKHCREQLHTTMQCMHLPIKMALYGASDTTVEEAFESVVTLMSCHLQEFRQELAAILVDEEDAAISHSIDSLNVCWEDIACYKEGELEALSFNDFADALEAMSNRCAAGVQLVVLGNNQLELKDYHALSYAERLFERRYPGKVAEGLLETIRADSKLVRVPLFHWTEAELEAQHSSKLIKVKEQMIDFLKADKYVQVISFEGGPNAGVVADGMDAVDYVEHLINAKTRTDLTTTARWELDSLRVLDLRTLQRVKLVMIGRRADGQKIVVYRKGSQGDVLVGEEAIAHVANLIEDLQTEVGDSQ